MQLKESFERLPLLLLFALLLLGVLHCHLGTTPKLIKAAAAVTARWKRRPGCISRIQYALLPFLPLSRPSIEFPVASVTHYASGFRVIVTSRRTNRLSGRNQCEYLGRLIQEREATSLLTPRRVTSHSCRDILGVSLSGPSSRCRMLKCMAQIAVYIAHLRGAKTPVKIAGTQPAEHLGPTR